MCAAMADTHKEALQRYEYSREAWRENFKRAREDLLFSNPSDPQQWDDAALKVRQGRPCLTFDRTNQFIRNVVNDARINKPSIQVIPADSKSDPEVAIRLQGMIRHIEYVSRASAAYDTAIEMAVRCGVGWLRVIPKKIDYALNLQEPQILRIGDPLSCLIDPDSVEPDGCDAMFGWALSVMTRAAFERMFPKAKLGSWKVDGQWFLGDDRLVVAEYQYVIEAKENRIVVPGPGGTTEELTEDAYWKRAEMGERLPVIGTYEGTKRAVKWAHMTGEATIDEVDFPSEYIGIIPVYGNDLTIEGRRYVSGMTRELRDSQQFVNYELSALAEFLRNQPKAPFLAPWQSVQGHEQHWAEMAEGGNPAVLYYDAHDADGNALPAPSRLAPPMFPAGFANAAQIGSQLMESAVGVYKANLGMQSNETSGRAINARKVEGETATFHYPDNLARSMSHLGRVVLDMLPRLIDTKRSARILGEDESVDWVTLDPEMMEAVQRDGKKVTAINPGFGKYDVRVKVGPGYVTMREQASETLVQLSQGNPQLAAALAPLLVKMQDLPEADKITRIALALLPPQVQAAYGEDEGEELPPAVMAQMQALQGQVQQAQQIVRELAGELEKAQAEAQAAKDKTAIDAYNAETNRLKVTQPAMGPEQIQALVIQTLQQLATPTTVAM